MLRFLPKFYKKSKFTIKDVQFRKVSDKSLDKNVKEAPEIHDSTSSVLSGKIYLPGSWNKFLLVWSGVYKSKEEIPKYVSYEAVHKAKNIVRIKIANYMILATIIGCILVAISGRRAAERGETVSKMNLDWHKKIKEDAEKETPSR